jgi:hypothetical protein
LLFGYRLLVEYLIFGNVGTGVEVSSTTINVKYLSGDNLVNEGFDSHTPGKGAIRG